MFFNYSLFCSLSKFKAIDKSLTVPINPPASIVSNPSLDGIVDNAFISSKLVTFPSTIPPLISKAGCSLAKLLNALIGAIASLENAIALGPSKASSRLYSRLFKALLVNVFFQTL